MLEEKRSCSPRKPAFFPIPIFTPLLRSYNIPEPVIVPPGPDSYPFLNPNHQFLEKLSPMDVDPCVVSSRGETVARITHLTAAEHAGVPLSEPTEVCTTSGSPANPEVSASQTVTTTVPNPVCVEYDQSVPQTVKDEFVTKFDSKKANLIICDVCNVTCNSEKTFKTHMEGKTHLKNTQKLNLLSTSKQETPSPVVDETSNQESEKKNQDLVSSPIKQETPSLVTDDTLNQELEVKNRNLLWNEASVNSLFFCGIPDPGCDYQKIAIEESGYIPPLLTGPSCKPISVRATAVQPSNGGRQNGPPKLDTQQPSRDTTPVKTDLTGDSEDRKTWCEICNIHCNPCNNFIKHVSGNRHKKNLQKLEEIPSFPSKLSASETTQCDLCGICCTSLGVLNEHIKGKKHQKNLKKTEKHFGDSHPAIVAKSWSQDPMNEKEVVLLDRSKRKDDGSLTSVEHAHPKRQKIMMKEEIFNGLETFKIHLAGSKHSSVVMKQSNKP